MKRAVEALGSDPRPAQAKALKGPLQGYYALRVGIHLRVVYTISSEGVEVIAVATREGVYDMMKNRLGAKRANVAIERFNDMGLLGRPIVGGDWNERDLHNYAIDLDGAQVGVVQVFAPSAEDHRAIIGWINVNEEARRQGVATEVYRLLSQQYDAPVEAESFTDLGEKWWRGMGKNSSMLSLGAIKYLPSSPLDYSNGYNVNTRIVIIEGDDFSKHPYFLEGDVDPGTVAFADLEVRGDLVFIAYLAVRPDHRRRGLARQLVEEIYRRWPSAEIHWGKLMQPEMGKLYDDFREREPERTVGGSRFY